MSFPRAAVEGNSEEVANDYPDVTLEHMLVDNAAMKLIRTPTPVRYSGH